MRVCRAVVALALGATIALLAQGVMAGTLYVTNRGSGELAILDEATLKVRALIPVGERAWGVAVAPDGRAACVSYAAGLAGVDLAAGRVAWRRPLGGQGMGVAISRDGPSATWRSIGATATGWWRWSGPVAGSAGGWRSGSGPSASTSRPTGGPSTSPEHDAFALSVIEAASLTKRRTIPLKPVGEGAFDKPHYLAISPDGARLYLPFQGRALVAIDTATWAMAVHPLAIDAHQHGIAISGDGRRLYLANNVFGGEGSLSELDATTFRELSRIPLGKHHEQLALDPVGRRVYLTGGFALGGHDELTVVELATGAVSRVGTGGRAPFAILRLP